MTTAARNYYEEHLAAGYTGAQALAATIARYGRTAAGR